MNPVLRKLDVDSIAARLDAAGDAEAATALRTLRDAVHRQDEALRDLVADAASIEEHHDEDGTHTEVRCRANGFDELAAAFGYPPVEAVDRAEAARDGEAGPYAGVVPLSGLEHLTARMWTEGRPAEELASLGFVPVQVGRETLYHLRGDREPDDAATPPGP